MKIGIILENLKTHYENALSIAEELGVDGVQFYGNNYAPASCPLPISAICAEIDGDAFESYNQDRILKTFNIMDLSKKLGCRVVTSHIGVIDISNKQMKKAVEKIGKYGDEIGVKFAIETGPEQCTILKSFIECLDTNSVGVNFDPANLVMVTGDDPIKGVKTLQKYIYHCHIKDGVMLKQTDPKIIYDYFKNKGIEDINLREYFLETPLGQGKVDLKGWIKALKEIGYKGYLTIERETGKTPIEDIKEAIRYTKGLIECKY